MPQRGYSGFTVDGPGMRRITSQLQERESSHAPPSDRGANRQQLQSIVEGILLEDLDATDDPEAPSFALFQSKTPAHLSDRWVNEIKPSRIKVLNRTSSVFLSGTIGIAVEMYPDKWWFISAGTTNTLRHAIVQEKLDCGLYTVEIARWVGGAGGSASASGSGEPCNPCGDVAGSGTASCGLSISYPEPTLLGTGVLVEAHDYASPIIPLVIGSGCLITTVSNPSDTSSSASASASASESASGSDEAETWHVVRGLQRHVVQYKERGKCCADGSWKTTHKTPIILIGIECDEIECELCPEDASASGS